MVVGWAGHYASADAVVCAVTQQVRTAQRTSVRAGGEPVTLHGTSWHAAVRAGVMRNSGQASAARRLLCIVRLLVAGRVFAAECADC